MVIAPILQTYNFCRWNISPFSHVCKRLITCQNTAYIFGNMSVTEMILMVFMLNMVLPSLSTSLFICKRLDFSPLFQL